jgi:hypothetical protein
MTFADDPREGMKKVQRAQNTMAHFYADFMAALKKVIDELPLHFDRWEPFEYDTDADGGDLWTIPVWDTDCYSAMSHLPLISSDHHFSTLKPEELRGEAAKTGSDAGDAYLTLRIAPNRAVLAADFSGHPAAWPVSLPVEGPRAEVVIFRVSSRSERTLKEMWGNAPYPEGSAPEGKAFDTGYPELQGWSKTFDLAEFLTDPASLFAEIRAVLAGQA